MKSTINCVFLAAIFALPGCKPPNTSDLQGIGTGDGLRALGFIAVRNFRSARELKSSQDIQALYMLPKFALVECTGNAIDTADAKLYTLEQQIPLHNTFVHNVAGRAQIGTVSNEQFVEAEGCRLAASNLLTQSGMSILNLKIIGISKEATSAAEKEEQLRTFVMAQSLYLSLRGSTVKGESSNGNLLKLMELSEAYEAAEGIVDDKSAVDDFRNYFTRNDPIYNPCVKSQSQNADIAKLKHQAFSCYEMTVNGKRISNYKPLSDRYTDVLRLVKNQIENDHKALFGTLSKSSGSAIAVLARLAEVGSITSTTQSKDGFGLLEAVAVASSDGSHVSSGPYVPANSFGPNTTVLATGRSPGAAPTIPTSSKPIDTTQTMRFPVPQNIGPLPQGANAFHQSIGKAVVTNQMNQFGSAAANDIKNYGPTVLQNSGKFLSSPVSSTLSAGLSGVLVRGSPSSTPSVSSPTSTPRTITPYDVITGTGAARGYQIAPTVLDVSKFYGSSSFTSTTTGKINGTNEAISIKRPEGAMFKDNEFMRYEQITRGSGQAQNVVTLRAPSDEGGLKKGVLYEFPVGANGQVKIENEAYQKKFNTLVSQIGQNAGGSNQQDQFYRDIQQIGGQQVIGTDQFKTIVNGSTPSAAATQPSAGSANSQTPASKTNGGSSVNSGLDMLSSWWSGT